jgi:two-component system, chemotaxis family, chemotaxis protein CheY
MITSVLIVDDSGVSRKVVQHCLEYSGLKGREFLYAANGALALDILSKRTVDLMITDLSMPVMDGPALVTALTKMPSARGMIIIVATSLASGPWEVELRSKGVSAVVRKPLNNDSFTATLAKLESGQTAS